MASQETEKNQASAEITPQKLDDPRVLPLLFAPRPDCGPAPAGAEDLSIEVEAGVRIAARFFPCADPEAVTLIFFHGNGEVVADYDGVGPEYVAEGLNFLAVEYRGYGGSGGAPTVRAMLQDAHRALAQLREWLAARGRRGQLVVMGRSLGSVPAIELAATEEAVGGLIVESGIARTLPLLATIGVDVAALGLVEEDGFGNLEKMAQVRKPTYILHAQHDRIIPLAEAEELQSACAARSKEFQMIPGADHNNILEKTGKLYFRAIRQFTRRVGKGHGPRRPGVRA